MVLEQAQVSDSARKQEMRRREELEILLATTRKQREELVKIKEKAATGLESSMKRLAILDDRTRKMNLRMCEAAAELEVIQSSIETLRQEKAKAQMLEERPMDYVEGCSYRHTTLPNCTSITCGDHSCSFRELTLFDLQSATCNFSEGFKIWSQGHKCIYKGHIMNKGVMIHKLDSDSIQSMCQFQQEVLHLMWYIFFDQSVVHLLIV
jgi:hypothetical protein